MKQMWQSILTLVVVAPMAWAAGPVRIQWFGQSFFVIQSSTGVRVAIDPHALEGFGRPTTTADLVLISHPHPDHMMLEAIENRAKAKVMEGIKYQPAAEGMPPRQQFNPLDEKFKDFKIRTVGTFHDPDQGQRRGKNTVFVIDVDGFKIVHLGDLGHVLTDDQVKQIGPIDVLMIPVGGVYTINGEKAKEVVAQLKPARLILPMHYGTRTFDELPGPEEFLEGQTEVQKKLDTNEITVTPGPKPAKPAIALLGSKK